MANHPPRLSKEQWAIIAASLHIALHFWSTGEEGEGQDSVVQRIKETELLVVKHLPPKDSTPIDEDLGMFFGRASDCDFLSKVFLAGILTVAMHEDPEARARMMATTVQELEKMLKALSSEGTLPPLFLEDDDEKEVLH